MKKQNKILIGLGVVVAALILFKKILDDNDGKGIGESTIDSNGGVIYLDKQGNRIIV